MAQARVPVFFAISGYLTDKYFDVAWVYHTPIEDLPKKINFFNDLIYGASVF